jgi:hypothetical protein
MAIINPADLTEEQIALYNLNTGANITAESAPVEVSASEAQSFGTPTATDIVGPTNTNTTAQAFGTPTSTDNGGTGSEIKPGQETTKQTFDDGSSVEIYPDGSTVTTNSDGEVSFNSTSAPAVQPNKEVPVSTQTFDDGSKLETFADGSTVTTNSDGEISFNSATVGEIQTDPKVPSSPADLSAADIAAHGPAYDDDGNLMPGYTLDEDNNPRWQGGSFVEPATAASAKASREEAAATNAAAATAKASAAKTEDKAPFKQKEDWRVRLSLAPSANYLYRDPAIKSSDLLYPLKETDGIVFPYLPTVSTAHKANYDPTELAHSNYKLYFYKNSSVDDVTITADFTAQDTSEANYMLAVIHFLKSATKMFYGQDGKAGPRAGTPPPLCYLSGFGAFQYDAHPLLITSFTYTLPNDVDYIRAGSKETWSGQSSMNPFGTDEKNRTGLGAVVSAISDLRMALGGLRKGAAPPAPKFKSLANSEATYVPTKLSITISAVPVVTRNDISNKFSLHDYATGSLLRGSKRSGGGIW